MATAGAPSATWAIPPAAPAFSLASGQLPGAAPRDTFHQRIEGSPALTELVHPHAAAPIYARIEIGHWLAQCGTRYCRDALRLEYGTGYLCPSCGVAQDVIWPTPDDARRIVALLGYRPDWATRNWLPGESVTDLMMENFQHGIEHATRPELGAAASILVLDASSGRPTLRVLDEPLIIDAAPQLAIGV